MSYIKEKLIGSLNYLGEVDNLPESANPKDCVICHNTLYVWGIGWEVIPNYPFSELREHLESGSFIHLDEDAKRSLLNDCYDELVRIAKDFNVSWIPGANNEMQLSTLKFNEF